MKKRVLILLLILFIVVGYAGYRAYNYFTSVERKVEKIDRQKVLTEDEIIEVAAVQNVAKEVKKKYKGKEDDTSPPDIEVIQEGEKLDFKEKEYPTVKLKILDESGIYRARLYIYYNGKKIGYVQQNPNTKSKDIEISFLIDGFIILDELKTLRAYEGADISFEAEVWDNNMLESKVKVSKKVPIIDNTPPDEVKSYWTYYYNENDEDIEFYNKDKVNSFQIYKVKDLPALKENEIVKYQYGLTTTDGTLLFRAGLDTFNEKMKTVKLEIDGDGKYVFFARAIDKNENISEDKVRVYIDSTPPEGSIKLENPYNQIPYNEMKVQISANDNLSGVFRYRLGDKDSVWNAKWKDYEEFATYKVPKNYGINELWCQLQDNALNYSKPIKANYFIKKKTTIDIKAESGDKEILIELDKKGVKRGNLDIKGRVEQ